MILKYALAGLVLLGGVNTYAQEEVVGTETQTEEKKRKTAAEKADKKVAQLTEALALSEEQAAKIKALTVTFIENVRQIKGAEALTSDEKKGKVKSLRETYNTNIEATLDATQKDKLAELKAEKKADKKPAKKTRGERAAEQTIELTDLLSLTSEQVEKVSALNQKVADKIEAIKSNDSFDKEKKREFIKGNKRDHKNAMTSILTTEQLVIYEEWLTTKKEEHKEKKAEKATE